MKKILLSIALVAISVSSVFAQENSAEKLRWKGIMNNGFWSNWEISVGGGVNYTAWNGIGNDQDGVGDLGWMVEGSVSKWFNPIVGARVQVIGGQLNASDDNGLKSNWIMPHADALLNLSNWIGGYREDRVYYAKLFAGFGVSIVNVNNSASAGFAFDAGLINTFRVCKALDINLELKGILNAGRDMPRGIDALAGKYGQIYSATLGLTYRFNKRNWDKAYSQEEVDGYLAAIAALEAGLADAHRNEGKLAERLAAQKAATDQALKDNEALKAELAKRKTSVVSASALFFNFDSAKLLDRAKASMQILQEVIKAAPKDQVFTIVGHADAKTGSPEYNQKLSERRAKAVYDYLVEQGVNPNQLTWKGVGSSQNIFPVNGTNRVVIVK
ncbi:OmpA family protein [Alistipes sp. Z76]|nr:OmpA family protein [Alistipes sp. Z76]NCE67972.1 OmpA family protein [Muribaculaceae bacterium M3]